MSFNQIFLILVLAQGENEEDFIDDYADEII